MPETKEVKETNDTKKMTLEEAIKIGVVYTQDYVRDLKKKLKQEVTREILAEHRANKNKSEKENAKTYLDGSGLSDVEFGKRLMKMNIQQAWLPLLNDHHKNLTNAQIWTYIQKNYSKIKVKR